MTRGPSAAWRSGGPLLGLAAAWTLFALAAGGPFLTWANHELMLLQTAVVGTAAVGATWIVVSGGVDLSVGASVALGEGQHVVDGQALLERGEQRVQAALEAPAPHLASGLAHARTPCSTPWTAAATAPGRP